MISKTSKKYINAVLTFGYLALEQDSELQLRLAIKYLSCVIREIPRNHRARRELINVLAKVNHALDDKWDICARRLIAYLEQDNGQLRFAYTNGHLKQLRTRFLTGGMDVLDILKLKRQMIVKSLEDAVMRVTGRTYKQTIQFYLTERIQLIRDFIRRNPSLADHMLILRSAVETRLQAGKMRSAKQAFNTCTQCFGLVALAHCLGSESARNEWLRKINGVLKDAAKQEEC